MIIDKILEKQESNQIAIIYKGVKITYKELYCTIAYNKKYLQSHNVREGEIYILQADNQLQFVITFLSLIACSVWVIPINKSIKEIDKIKKETNAIYLTKQIIENCSIIKSFTEYELDAVNGDSCGVFHISSGSTGIPKLCKRSMQCFYHEAISFSKLLKYEQEQKDRILSLCPLEHSFAFGAAFVNAIQNEIPLYIIDKFNPRSCLKYISDNQISILLLVPTMARLFCMSAITKMNYDIRCLRVPLVGAGPITPELYQNFYHSFGVKLKSNFGSSETGCIFSRIEDKNILSVGRPMYSVDIKICDDNGNRVYNQEGQLYVKWPGMILSYYNDNLELDSEGYFVTKDLVIEDSEGYIYVKGRKEKLINIGGKKVNPKEIEDTIMELEQVTDCVVYSKIKDSGEEIIKAYVVGANIDKSKIVEYLCEHLSAYKIPSVINVLSEIKRDSMGKIQIDSLK